MLNPRVECDSEPQRLRRFGRLGVETKGLSGHVARLAIFAKGVVSIFAKGIVSIFGKGLPTLRSQSTEGLLGRHHERATRGALR